MANKGFKIDVNKKKDNHLPKENNILQGGIILIKNRFLEIRLRLGYKFQKDFAEFLEVSQYQYNRYERNENQPSLEVLLKICSKDKLNIDPREIFYLG